MKTASGIRTLEGRAKAARIALILSMIAVVPVAIFYAFFFYLQLGSINPGLPASYAYLTGPLSLLLLLLYFIMACTTVPILMWVYRAHANLRESGMQELRHSPGWAVGSYFIPIANLFIPFTAMRALHNRSNGEEPWNADASVDAVTSWWACHLSAIFILAFTTATFLFNLLPGIWLTTPPAADTGLNLAGHLLLAGSAWFLFKIIGSVTQAQSSGMTSASVFE